MIEIGNDTLRRIREYYDFVGELDEGIDPLQAAMFVELEFGLTISDNEITSENLCQAEAAAELVARLQGPRAKPA
ncbi:MAG: hypothetical protein KAU31_17570 [Spirochaetaceae bacterium]|nr:hypothetical protein [Spirochaetaceae bacterium]